MFDRNAKAILDCTGKTGIGKQEMNLNIGIFLVNNVCYVLSTFPSPSLFHRLFFPMLNF